MKFVSMEEMTKAERKKENANMPALSSSSDNGGPRYPYGLELQLEKASIEKLGLDFNKTSVGDEIDISCKGRVTRLSSNERSGGGPEKSMSIQITDMAIDFDDELDWDTGPKKATEILKKREK